MSVIRQCVRLGQASVRRFGTNKVLMNEAEKTETFRKLLKDQEKFQREDGIDEVYIKGGKNDKILLGITYLLVAFGSVLTINELYYFCTH